MPYALLDDQGKMVWRNEAFMDVVGADNARKKSIFAILPELHREDMPDEEGVKSCHIHYEDRDFRADFRKITIDGMLENNSLVDTTDYEALDAAVSGESAKGNAHGCPAKAVYFEVLTNPLLQVNNVTAIAGIAHRHGAIAIVDNTFVTPYLQQPLDQGADIVIHSATKYLAGHSEVNAGLVVVKDDELGKRVYFAQNRLGGVLAPNECDSVRRGIQTLALRMDRQQENARAISSYLLLHPLVKSVHYPGLPGHEYELASNGLKGGGAVLSFEVVPGVDPADVLDNLHIFRLAVSLGAVESLAELPCRMTHFELPREERLKVGITDELVRLAVGIEDKQDLIEDLGQAFDIAYENYLKRHAGESLFTFAQHVYA